MIFGYPVEEIRKSIAAAVVSVAALIGYFVAVDPNTVESIVGVFGALLNVVAVFYATNEAPIGSEAQRLD